MFFFSFFYCEVGIYKASALLLLVTRCRFSQGGRLVTFTATFSHVTSTAMFLRLYLIYDVVQSLMRTKEKDAKYNTKSILRGSAQENKPILLFCMFRRRHDSRLQWASGVSAIDEKSSQCSTTLSLGSLTCITLVSPQSAIGVLVVYLEGPALKFVPAAGVPARGYNHEPRADDLSLPAGCLQR